jgi:hypothetical protein
MSCYTLYFSDNHKIINNREAAIFGHMFWGSDLNLGQDTGYLEGFMASFSPSTQIL